MTSSKPKSPHLQIPSRWQLEFQQMTLKGTQRCSLEQQLTGTPVKPSLETFKNIFWLALLCLGYEGEVLPRVRGGNRGILLVAARLETGFLSCERVGKFRGSRGFSRPPAAVEEGMAVGEQHCQVRSLTDIPLYLECPADNFRLLRGRSNNS